MVIYSLFSDLDVELHCSVVKADSNLNQIIDEIKNDPTNIVNVPSKEKVKVKSDILEENTSYNIICTFPKDVFNSNNDPYERIEFTTRIIYSFYFFLIDKYISPCPAGNECDFGDCDGSSCLCYITAEYNYETGRCDYEKLNVVIDV